MVKSIKLTNFFSFKNETISLEKGINLLVGINGSGKSNLLKAFQFLKVGVEGNSDDNALFKLITEKWGGFDGMYCSSVGENKFTNSIGLEFTLDGEAVSKYGGFNFRDNIVYKIIIIRKPNFDNYQISETITTEKTDFTYLNFIYGQGKISERIVTENGNNNDNSTSENYYDNYPSPIKLVNYEGYNPQELVLSKISALDKEKYLPLTTIKEAIKGFTTYTYFDTTPESKIRKATISSMVEKRLLADGSNLPQILNTLNLKHKPNFRGIQKILKEVNENFRGFDFNILGGGFLELYLDEDKLKRSVHIANVSDGTLRFLCLLSIFFNPNRGSLVCIDEPEVGLHPDMIFNITQLIKKASEKTTFIIVTHNPSVLNAFRIENIRVFEKNEFNETNVISYSEKDFEGWYEEFNPGAMWRAGDLGGKRW